YFDESVPPCGSACDACAGRAFVDLVKPIAPPTRTVPSLGVARGEGRAAVAPEPAAEVDEALFQRLRALRRALADGEGVPAYIAFSDAVLTRMAAMRPADEAGLLSVPGVGPAKLARYGAAFLRVLRELE